MRVVYALIDPTTNMIRYVGQTNHPEVRLPWYGSVTRSGRGTGNRHLDNWLRKLFAAGFDYETEVLESGFETQGELNDAEIFWHDYLKSIGCPLVNLRAPGGAKGKHSQETRMRMSQSASNRSAEYRAKIAASNRRRVYSLETRQKISDALRGRRLSESHLEKLRNYRHTDESKRKLSAAKLGKPHSEAHKQAMRGRKATAEERAKMSAAMREVWRRRRERGD